MDRRLAWGVAGIGLLCGAMLGLESAVRLRGYEHAAMLFLVAVGLAPGVQVLRRPEARWLALWAGVAAAVGIAVLFAVDRELARLSPWLLAGNAMFAFGVLPGAAYVVHALACRAAGPGGDGRDERDDGPRAQALRAVVRLVLLFGVAALAVGLLPGWREYEDSNDCVGRALGTLVSGGHGAGGGCSTAYDTLLGEHAAGGPPLWLFLAGALCPGIAVYADPRRRWLVAAWVATMLASGVLAMVLTFDLHLFTHVVELWPLDIVRGAVGAILLLAGVAAPTIALVVPAVRAPTLPTARVV